MQERFKTSPQYAQKIAQVRELSAKGENTNEAREQAKMLRMEFLLDNAKCAKLLTEFIEKNPTANMKEFDRYAVSTGLISQPKIAQKFIDQLQIERDRVFRAKQEIESQSTKGKEERVFSWISKTRRKPKGKLYLNLNYPLAIILYVENPEDFSDVDVRENVGGFYNNQQGYKKENAKNFYDYFPIVVINGYYSKYDDVEYEHNDSISNTTSHEIGHVRNRSMIDSLKATGRKTVWSRLSHSVYDYIQEEKTLESVKRLKSKTGLDLERARKSEDWNIVLDSALFSAKDELLAEFEIDSDLRKKKNDLQERKGLYDYFFNIFGIKFGSELYKLMWKDYENIIEAAGKVVEKIRDGYNLGGRILWKKIAIFRWVLVQIPIQDWPKQIEEALFYEEIKELREAYEIAIEIPAKEKGKGYKEFSSAEIFLREIENNQEKPLLPIIREFKQNLANLDYKQK